MKKLTTIIKFYILIFLLIIILSALHIFDYLPGNLYYIIISIINIPISIYIIIDFIFFRYFIKFFSYLMRYKGNLIYINGYNLKNFNLKKIDILEAGFLNYMVTYKNYSIFKSHKIIKPLITFYKKYYKKLYKLFDMGEIAEDMIDGTCCSTCGCYFKDPGDESLFTHGYPVECWDCWTKKSNLPRAEVDVY